MHAMDQSTQTWKICCLVMTMAGLVGALLRPTGAAVVTDRFSYDGSYQSNAASPPAGQTTWTQYVGTGASITPNSPTAGIASVVDSLTGAGERVAFYKTGYSSPFVSAAANYEWEYSARLRIDALASTAGGPSFLGVRDEGGAGKVVMLGWSPTSGSLGFYGNTGTVRHTVSTRDYRDGQYHTYRVRKFVDPADGQMKVQATVDGGVQGSVASYAAVFPDDDDGSQGFGYFSSSPATSTFVVDEVRFGASHAPKNAYQQAVLASMPAAYYPFEDSTSASGSAAIDANGQIYNATYGTNVVQAQGPHGIGGAALLNATAVGLSGSLDSASFVETPTLGNFGSQLSNSFSVELWVNTSDTSSIQQALGRLEDATKTAFVLEFNRTVDGGSQTAKSTSFYLRDSAGRVLSESINKDIYDGKWHQLVYAVDNPLTNAMRIYVDGQLQLPSGSVHNLVAGSTFTNLTNGLGVLAINNRATGAMNHFKGLLDEVAFYTHALSAAEIQAHLDALPRYKFSYDGTYQPGDTAPPLTQSTWAVYNSAAITPNVGGQVGYARFNDDSIGKRVSINKVLGEDLSDEGWAFETRLKIDSYRGAPTFIGVRDEGGNGKTVMLGWDASGALRFYDNSDNGFQLINGADFVDDGQFHVYRVEKRTSPGGAEIQVFVDGLAQFITPLNYSIFPDDSGSDNGFGYFSSTPGTSDITLDYLYLQVLVPEPGTWALLATGAVLLAAGVVRRRRS